MDPRKGKNGSTSSKGRGRGSRSQPVRPQVQSQPSPYYPQMSPQAGHYYPQPPPMNLPSHQHQYYPQPPPYIMSMTNDFEPFGEYRDAPTRREPSVERPLPQYDYEDDDVEYVPETQQENPTAIGVFNGLYIQSLQKRLRKSGCSDLDVLKNALADYEKKTNGKDFTHIEAWEVVRGENKWLEQPCVGQEASASSEKRRKSSSSSYYETGSNDNVETVLPDLNDDTTSTRKRKGKKAESFDSTNESIAESFDNYVISKTQILESIAEKRSAKDDLAEKLLSAQIRNIEEKAYHRALRFYNQPHDHINDPRMREITIAKKREYAEKYG